MSGPLTTIQTLSQGLGPGSPSKRISRTCRFCPRSFFKTEHLHRHERSHTKERPYHCKECGKSFSRTDTLLRHTRAHVKDPEDHGTVSDESSPHASDGGGAATPQMQLSNVLNLESCPSQSRMISPPPSLPPYSKDATTSHELEENPGPDLRSMAPVEAMEQVMQEGAAFELSPLLDSRWPREDESNHYPSWHVGDDFDLEAFNMSLLVPMTFNASTWKETSFENVPVSGTVPSGTIQSLCPAVLNVVQNLWTTRTDNAAARNVDEMSYSVAPTRAVSPVEMSPTTMDERYREGLSKRLRPRWKEDPLPSTEFLNLALQLFFTRFNPIFPILHAPTFRPNNHNSLLLLSLCSIGSLFIGSSSATTQGAKIFERLNKVILASWENVVTRNSPQRTSMVQAAIIGQTFGYLSGNPKHLAIVESFHGTVIWWARRDGMFTTSQEQPSDYFQPHQELDETWNAWARLEEKKRTAMGLYIHDAQLASLFHHDPNLRHGAIQLSVAASNELFSAPSATQWAHLMRRSPPSQTVLQEYIHFSQPQEVQQHPLPIEISCAHSRLSCYVILHGIEAAVAEAGQTCHISTNQQLFCKFRDALICWYHAYGNISSPTDPDVFCLMVLWHKIFMSLLVDFDSLERAIGREGSADAIYAQDYASTWASSIEAKRCIMHASLISDHLAAMRVGAEPAIHVPCCMFSAAIAWYCYTKFGAVDNPIPGGNEALDFLEIKALRIHPEQHLFEVCGFTGPKPTVIGAGPLRGLTDMLNKLGHWDISRRFARILGLLIHGDTDGHLVN